MLLFFRYLKNFLFLFEDMLFCSRKVRHSLVVNKIVGICNPRWKAFDEKLAEVGFPTDMVCKCGMLTLHFENTENSSRLEYWYKKRILRLLCVFHPIELSTVIPLFPPSIDPLLAPQNTPLLVVTLLLSYGIIYRFPPHSSIETGVSSLQFRKIKTEVIFLDELKKVDYRCLNAATRLRSFG